MSHSLTPAHTRTPARARACTHTHTHTLARTLAPILQEERMQNAGVPVVVEMSALSGKGVGRLLPQVVKAFSSWDAK